MQHMQAIILAGGLGRRLRPITDYVPKPLVPIDNIPILEWQIKGLKRFGINDVTVCTGYMTEQIESFLELKSGFGIKTRVSVEKKPLGTGGAIRNAAGFIRENSFFVLNGDIITDIDLRVMQKTPNTIAGIELRTQFGTLDVSGDMVNAFEEKRPIKNIWMNAGIYHLSQDILERLPKNGDIERTTFPEMARRGDLSITRFQNVMWFSIDSHKDIQECSGAIKSMIK